MKGIIFDLDGVLINSMPAHFEAWRRAFNEIANIDVNERMVYLLEGMRGIDLAKRVLELNNIDNTSFAQPVTDRKSEIFRLHLRNLPKPFVGVHALLEKSKCLKAVVSGSNREDVNALLKPFKNIEFDVIITADDIGVGKPDPLAFITALRSMNIDKGQAIVIENAPLGIDAANTAGIQSLVVLNNSPLNLRDFDGKIDKSRILKDTESASIPLNGWCS
jgi:beta-phosphoglucomutase